MNVLLKVACGGSGGTKVRSYMEIMARFSSPALQRISAAAVTRHFLLAVLEGLNFLRTKLQLSEKQVTLMLI